MPLYTYRCECHGEFSAWAEMSQSDARQGCPACAQPAARALAKPRLAKGEGGTSHLACDSPACGSATCMPEPAPRGHVCAAGCLH
jgi:putative FmdB family regulatory protein